MPSDPLFAACASADYTDLDLDRAGYDDGWPPLKSGPKPGTQVRLIPKVDPDDPRLSYSPADVAAILNVSVRFVITRVRSGQIQAFRLGRLWRIPASEVDRIQREGLA
jgi:excisionase family DNA binding protein